jgi:hypothetical protein
MHPNSATTIAEVTPLGPVNGLRGLQSFRPDPSYGALSTFRPDPSYGALAGAAALRRSQNRFPYGMSGLGEFRWLPDYDRYLWGAGGLIVGVAATILIRRKSR